MKEVIFLNKGLKKCPFCGSGAKMVLTMGGFYYCMCEGCGVHTKSMPVHEAEKAWNKRIKIQISRAEEQVCNSIGKRINKIRNKREINIKELAEAVGTSYHILDAVELGKTYPDFKTLVNLARALDTTTDYLLGNTRKQEKTNDE